MRRSLIAYDYLGRVASLHRGKPGGAYTSEVVRRLEEARSELDAFAILDEIRDDLLNGRIAIYGAK